MPYEPVFCDQIEYTHDFNEDGLFPSVIETDRLVMEPLLESISGSNLLEFYQENEGTDRYFDTDLGLPMDYKEFSEFVDTANTLEEEGSDMFYGIFESESGEFIGQATFEDVDWELGRCAIGIWIRQDFWGEGISQERAEALMYVAFDDLGMDLVEITVVPENENSLRAVEKYISEFGGSFDGRQRHATVTPMQDGVYDVVHYSVTADEFFGDSTTDTDELFLESN